MKKAQKKWKLARDWKGDAQMKREASRRGVSLYASPVPIPEAYDVHVICCNDAIMGAAIGDEAFVTSIMEQLIVKDYQRQKWNYPDSVAYLDRLYWHTHIIDLHVAKGAVCPTSPNIS